MWWPRGDARLSWPGCLVGLPAQRQPTVPVLTGLDVEQLCWLYEQRYHYAKLPTEDYLVSHQWPFMTKGSAGGPACDVTIKRQSRVCVNCDVKMLCSRGWTGTRLLQLRWQPDVTARLAPGGRPTSTDDDRCDLWRRWSWLWRVCVVGLSLLCLPQVVIV